jgi:hypothetical protein
LLITEKVCLVEFVSNYCINLSQTRYVIIFAKRSDTIICFSKPAAPASILLTLLVKVMLPDFDYKALKGRGKAHSLKSLQDIVDL